MSGPEAAPPFYTAASLRTEPSLAALMKAVIGSVTQEVDRRLVGSGLTDAQWIPMLLIHTGRSRTASEIARAASLDVGAVTRMVDRLEAKSLLVRERSAADRRVIHLRLTDAGSRAAANVPGALAAVLNGHLAGFTTGEWQTLLALLKRMRANGRGDA